jgi:predicted nucleic acid-binding protein
VIVVSDTSPINYLILVGQIDVLPRLFQSIYVPPAVMTELNHPKAPDVVRRWIQTIPAWINIQKPLKLNPATTVLDQGEAEALSLALEMSAKGILIDERKGRRVAKSQGLVTIGTVTVLELAAQKGFLQLQTALNDLRKTSFQISPELIQAALEREAGRLNLPNS